MHDLATGARTGSVPLPGPGTVGGIGARPEGGHEAWFAYTDNATPAVIMHYDAARHRRRRRRYGRGRRARSRPRR